jgi:hypothetical protein
VRPISVTLIQKPDFVRVGQDYELVCQAFGSKPAAVITWFKGNQIIDDAKVTVRKTASAVHKFHFPTFRYFTPKLLR